MDRELFSAVERKVSLSMLLAFYGELLTENQREMARLHWEEDLTLTEIAQQFSVSRQSVHDTVNRTEKQLEGLEEKLHLMRRMRQTQKSLLDCQRALDQVVPTPDTRSDLQAARRIVKSLMDQEDQ